MDRDNLFASFRNHERFMGQALKEAQLAADKGEVPVGAVIVRNGQIIGRGHNQTESLKDPTAHAEILAIGAAGGQGESWRLDETTLYVTLEPCTMCSGAILLARVGHIVFGATDPRAGCGGDHRPDPGRQSLPPAGGGDRRDHGRGMRGHFDGFFSKTAIRRVKASGC